MIKMKQYNHETKKFDLVKGTPKKFAAYQVLSILEIALYWEENNDFSHMTDKEKEETHKQILKYLARIEKMLNK